MDIYIYLALILALIFIGYELITSTIKYCPIKVKESIVLIFIIISLRVMTLLILLVVDNIKVVYSIRNFIFLNIIYIPLIIFICIYIFYRNTKININWIYGVFFLGVSIYILCILIYPIEYYISLSYGYNVTLSNQLPYKIILCVNVLSFFIGIISFRYKYSIKWGSVIIIVASLIFIGSSVIALKSSEHIGYLLIGDLSWIIALYSSILTFKIKAKRYNSK